jgi:formylglycine-generating enzyme required for sulfatase activity
MLLCNRREWLRTTGLGLVACGVAAGSGAVEEDDGMVVIPAGPFFMGTRPEQAEALARQYGHHVSWLSGEVPGRTIRLPVFAIGRYPVTNRQFAEFCRATGHPARAHWGGPQPPAHLLDHPVICVDQSDAWAYARWAGKRLPTEAEWEKAARGPDGRLYPWGEEFDPAACQWNRDHAGPGPGTAPVTAHPSGASPYGVMDLCGNAAEWCGDGPAPFAAYIKGGCWLTESPLNLRPAARNMSGWSNNPLDYYGFRCAREVG